jgi:hypothetical protein
MIKSLSKHVVFLAVSYICLAPICVSEEHGAAGLMSVFVFSNFIYDADYNPNGKYVRPTLVDPVLTEYKILKHWDGNEKSTSPGNFDVVVVSENYDLRDSIDAVLEIELFGKIGKLVVNQELNVIDLIESKKMSAWSDKSIIKVDKNIKINKDKKYESFKIDNISLDSIISMYSSKNMWPFGIKVVASLKCNDYCASEKEIYYVFDMTPDI